MSTPVVSGVTKKVLTHEVGAGAPCLTCGDKCPGLDLHFWRKICRNCKCKQENHDVNASVSSKGIDNIAQLLIKDSGKTLVRKEKESESSSSKQVPPKISTSSPISEPEKQVPSVNSSVDKTPTPIKSTELVYDKIKKEEGNVPNVDATKTQAQDSLPPPLPYEPSTTSHNDLMPPPPVNQNSKEEDLPPMPKLQQEFQEKVTTSEEPKVSPQKVLHESPTKVVHTTSEALPKTEDLPPPQEPVVEEHKTMEPPQKADVVIYDWSPPVSDPKLMQEYLEALPKDKQPIAGTEGAQYRKKQLMRQLPTHDQEPNDCHDLTPQETEEMQIFIKQYREKALGVASVDEGGKVKTCAECEEAIKVGDPIVWAERAGHDKHWHAACFICAECKEMLVDLIYFYNEEKIYCGRHYCELHKPRCSACDELIFAPEYTQAEDSYWHLKHFCCWHCDQPLGGKNYVPHNNQPVCIPCYEKSFANTCSTCKEIIAPDTEWVTFEDHHWHANPNCFKCSQCDQSLVGKPCIPKGDMVFCCSKCKKEKIPPVAPQ